MWDWLNPMNAADPADILNKRSKGRAAEAYKAELAKAEADRAKIKAPSLNMGDFSGSNTNQFGQAGLKKAGLWQNEFDQTGLNNYRTQAARAPGSASDAANIMQSNRERDLGQNLQNAAAQNASGTANAWSQMAQSNGLRGGQATRMAMAGANQLAAGQQGLRAGSAQQAGDIRLQDEQQRLGMLEKLPGMEQQYRAPSLTNMQTKLGLMGTKLGLAQNKYQGDIDMWGNLLSAKGAVMGGT